MAETFEETRVRLIDDGWLDRLFVKSTGDAACPHCGYTTNSQGDCLCHEAWRHQMSPTDFLIALGRGTE